MNNINVIRISEKATTKYQRITIGDLHYGNYQRALNTAWVNKMAKNFEEGLLGVLIVSYRDGKHYVIDGQHRLEAAKRAGVEDLVCQVHTGLTYETEAELFNKYNRERKKLTPLDIFKAELEAGDSGAIKISQLIESHGFILGTGGGNAAHNGIVAIAMLKDIYRKEGEENLDRVLGLIRATWYGERTALQRNMLGGLSVFIKLYGDDFEDSDFIDKLKRTHPDVIVREGRHDAQYSQSAKITTPYAKVIWRLYNVQRRAKTKLEDKFIGAHR